MNSVDVFRATDVDLRFSEDGEGIVLKLGGIDHTYNFEALSVMESALIRLFFALPRTQVHPGVETNKILDFLDKKRQNDAAQSVPESKL